MNETRTAASGVDGSGLAPIDFAVVGVGGQGVILASDILAEVGLAAGFDVKKTDSIGMSQRGGSVVSFVRWAPEVFSPMPQTGRVDAVLALEKLEAGRGAPWLKEGGIAIVNDQRMTPPTVRSGSQQYPTDDSIRSTLAERHARLYWVDGEGIAESLGNVRVANVLLLGFLSAFLTVDQSVWHQTLEGLLPGRILPVNINALQAGRRLAEKMNS